MCRFLAYKGESILLADLLTRPYHSLIKQSYCAKLREEPLNGDGFGLGWYDLALSPEPGLFTSLTPAWGNINLQRIAEKLKSSCFFAHVRAATPGLVVNDLNCHPFRYKNLLWMHNGYVDSFLKIKRKLRAWLSDEYYHMILGTSDSEHAFAVFLNFLPEDFETCTTEMMVDAMRKTIEKFNQWTDEAGIKDRCNYNFAVTDGSRLVVSRYAANTKSPPESLYYTEGSRLQCIGGTPRIKDVMKSHESIVVSSEPVTEDSSEWEEVTANSLIAFDENNDMVSIKL